MRPDGPRPTVAGPDTPAPPFPIPVSGPIVRGFGRGSAELGIPTANIPLAGLRVGGHDDLESGVYYGWAGVAVDGGGRALGQEENAGRHAEAAEAAAEAVVESESAGNTEEEFEDGISVPGGTVFPMVMSLGYNPVYKNTVRSIEVHIMRTFQHDFYGAKMNLLICGFIRPEYDYVSKESLVEDIKVDIEVARRSLRREGYRGLLSEEGGWWRRLVDFTPIGVEEAAQANGEVNGKL